MPSIFLTYPHPLQYAVLRSDGKIYNFTSQGWDALPDTGIPAAANLQALSPFATKGPLANQQFTIFPSVVSASGSIAIATFTAATDGTLSQVDCLNFADIQMPLRGGVGH